MQKTCARCAVPIWGRKDKIYCSDKCCSAAGFERLGILKHNHCRGTAGAHHRGEWFKWGFDAETIIAMMKDGSLKIAEAETKFAPLPKHKRLGACLTYSQSLVEKNGKRTPRHDTEPASDARDSVSEPARAS